MDKVYLRETSSNDDEVVLQLPHYTKFLLLASYLASSNPSRTDRQFFSKVSVWLLAVS